MGRRRNMLSERYEHEDCARHRGITCQKLYKELDVGARLIQASLVWSSPCEQDGFYY